MAAGADTRGAVLTFDIFCVLFGFGFSGPRAASVSCQPKPGPENLPKRQADAFYPPKGAGHGTSIPAIMAKVSMHPPRCHRLRFEPPRLSARQAAPRQGRRASIFGQAFQGRRYFFRFATWKQALRGGFRAPVGSPSWRSYAGACANLRTRPAAGEPARARNPRRHIDRGVPLPGVPRRRLAFSTGTPIKCSS